MGAFGQPLKPSHSPGPSPVRPRSSKAPWKSSCLHRSCHIPPEQAVAREPRSTDHAPRAQSRRRWILARPADASITSARLFCRVMHASEDRLAGLEIRVPWADVATVQARPESHIRLSSSFAIDSVIGSSRTCLSATLSGTAILLPCGWLPLWSIATRTDDARR